MSNSQSDISEGRQLLYYSGMGLSLIGLLLFPSFPRFVTAPARTERFSLRRSKVETFDETGYNEKQSLLYKLGFKRELKRSGI